MKARDIMTADPQCVTLDDELSRAAEIMRDVDVGIVPVVENKDGMRLAGVITDRDIAVRHVAEHHDGECKVRDHMTSGRIDTVRPDADIDEIMTLMKRDQVRRVPVVEDGDRLVGIVAQADLALDTGRSKRDEVAETVERISEPVGARR